MTGFHTRYLNREKILKVYEKGLPGLISLIQDTECLVFEDEFSEKISNIVLNDDYLINDKMMELIKN